MSVLSNLTDRVKETFDYVFAEEVISDEDLLDENPPKRPARMSASAEPKAEKSALFLHKEEPAPEQPKPRLELHNKPQAAPVQEEEEPVRKSFLNFRKKNEAKEKLSEAPEMRQSPKTITLPVENKIINVVILEPVDFNDSQKVADYLRRNQPVVVNFTNTDPVVAKRMSDYISGTIYALNGGMKKLGRSILVCAPKNVDIDAGTESEEKF